MSRVANLGVTVPSGVDVRLDGSEVLVKGGSAELRAAMHESVRVALDGQSMTFVPADASRKAHALSGTMRQIVNNMIIGVTQGFEKRLALVGVGFRAQAQGSRLNLQVGFSHPVSVDMPEGMVVETPTPTEIVLKGADRQQVGQMAAVIRALRPPEPYKGKGIRYADERVSLKETKKK